VAKRKPHPGLHLQPPNACQGVYPLRRRTKLLLLLRLLLLWRDRRATPRCRGQPEGKQVKTGDLLGSDGMSLLFLMLGSPQQESTTIRYDTIILMR
jgi:hypothetical protein